MKTIKQECFKDKDSYKNFLEMAKVLEDVKEKVARLDAEGRNVVVLDSDYSQIDLNDCEVIVAGTESRIMVNECIIYAGHTHDSNGKIYVSNSDVLALTNDLNIFEKL